MISWTDLLTSTLNSKSGLAKTLKADCLRYSSLKSPKVVVWNITSRCNLACQHCYFEATPRKGIGELTTEEAKSFIKDLAKFSGVVLLFSGGEPLLRKDIFQLGSFARDNGIRPVLSTNGTLISDEVSEKIKEAGFSYVGISLDGAKEINDWFRRKSGAFDKTLSGIRNCKKMGLKVGIRFTLTRHNFRDLPYIFDLAERECIERVCFYHLVYAGRGKNLKDEDVTHEERRKILELIWERSLDFNKKGLSIEVLTVDNHSDGAWIYLRLRKRNPKQAKLAFELLKIQGGNNSGIKIGAVDNCGNVYADQFLRTHPLGNIRQKKFSGIWQDKDNNFLKSLRNRKPFLKGRCQRCNYFVLCNGNFRARAEAGSGDIWGEDPGCYLTDEEIKGELPPQNVARPRQVFWRASNSTNSSNSMNVSNPNLRLIFWELTRKCNLKCAYCRREDYSSEGLSLDAALRVIDLIAESYRPIIVFSGGEPLLYRYLFEVAGYARSKNLPTALATNGTLIDRDLAKKIKAANFHRVAFSIDGQDPKHNDALRGRGTFLKVMAGIKYLRSEEIELQINTTVTKENFKQVHLIYKLALELGVRALHLFAFVPVGCGVDVPKEKRLCAEEYEMFLNEMSYLALESKIEIKLTCAPHYNRILAKTSQSLISELTKGCLAGSGVCFISSSGEVYPCGYLPLSAGNILKDTFREIWTESLLFKSLRNAESLKGKCNVCEYVNICGGCRARAYAKTGNYLEEEPKCVYQPLSVKS